MRTAHPVRPHARSHATTYVSLAEPPETQEDPDAEPTDQFCYRRRRLVVVAWLVILVATVITGSRFGGDNTTDYGTPGIGVQGRHQPARRTLPGPLGDTIDIVWRADDVTAADVRSQSRRRARRRRPTWTTSSPSPARTRKAARPRSPQDGTVAYATLQLDTWDMPVEVAQQLLDAAAVASGDAVQIELAGQAVQNAEQGAIGAEGVGFLRPG